MELDDFRWKGAISGGGECVGERPQVGGRDLRVEPRPGLTRAAASLLSPRPGRFASISTPATWQCLTLLSRGLTCLSPRPGGQVCGPGHGSPNLPVVRFPPIAFLARIAVRHFKTSARAGVDELPKANDIFNFQKEQ